MSKFSVRLQDKGRCVITHAINGSTVTTDLAPEYGGMGRAFSSTDLVASAVGTCLLTTLDKVLEREGYDSKKLEIKIEKELSNSPKQIKRVDVKIFHPEPFSDVLIKKLYNAAGICPVKRSLNSDVDVSIKFVEMNSDIEP
jgi:putative redox protein